MATLDAGHSQQWMSSSRLQFGAMTLWPRAGADEMKLLARTIEPNKLRAEPPRPLADTMATCDSAGHNQTGALPSGRRRRRRRKCPAARLGKIWKCPVRLEHFGRAARVPVAQVKVLEAAVHSRREAQTITGSVGASGDTSRGTRPSKWNSWARVDDMTRHVRCQAPRLCPGHLFVLAKQLDYYQSCPFARLAQSSSNRLQIPKRESQVAILSPAADLLPPPSPTASMWAPEQRSKRNETQT